MRIDRVEAIAIPDTRGRPTVEAAVFANTFIATASVPSGKSTGSHEACELRDSDGGVTTAVANVNGEIAKELVGRRFDSPDELDATLIALDGTRDKSRLGANAILAVSIAAMRLSALLEGIPLWKAIAKRAVTTPGAPRLYVNVMNGGAHADFKLPFQEYLLVVEGKASETIPAAQDAFSKLGAQLGYSSGGGPMGDEGGYAPILGSLTEPFKILADLVVPGSNMTIAIDSAASELFHDGAYDLLGEKYSPEKLSAFYGSLIDQFSLHSIEDPFQENAPDDFIRLTAALGGKTLVIGDDLTVTNTARIRDAAARKEINAVLIKPNQIGTVLETISAVHETRAAGLQVIASHRSGETNDTFIADFAYGIGAHGLKAGGFGQKERIVKYDRLLAIEKEAG